MQLEALKGAAGYVNVSRDLVAHSRFFKEFWAEVEGRSPLSSADIARADYIAERLLSGSALREGPNPDVIEMSLVRHQALTLLVKAYDEARRAVSFLRWRERDMELIVPTLYGNKTSKRNTEEPAEGSLLPAVGGVTTGTATTPATPPTEVIPVGHPGSNPFIS